MLKPTTPKQINNAKRLTALAKEALIVPENAYASDADFCYFMSYLEMRVANLHTRIMSTRKSYIGKKTSPEAALALYQMQEAHTKLIDGFQDLNEDLLKRFHTILDLDRINNELVFLSVIEAINKQEEYRPQLIEKLKGITWFGSSYQVYVDQRTQTFKLRCQHVAFKQFDLD